MGQAVADSTMPRNDTAVKVDQDVVDKARVVASFRKMPLAQYLTELLKKPVEVDWQEVGDLIHQRKPTKKKGNKE